MKKILVIISMFSLSAFAVEGNNNNTIIVKPIINVKGCCAANPCKQKTKVVTKTVVVEKQVPVVVEVEKKVYVDRVVEKRVVVVKKVQKKNRISLLGGLGPTRIDRHQDDRVDLIRGPVGGLMYQRLLNESLSIGVQGQTNQTVLGTVGYDF